MTKDGKFCWHRPFNKLAKPVFPATWTDNDTPPEFTGIKPDPWEIPTIIATIVVCGGASLGLALAKYMGWVE